MGGLWVAVNFYIDRQSGTTAWVKECKMLRSSCLLILMWTPPVLILTYIFLNGCSRYQMRRHSSACMRTHKHSTSILVCCSDEPAACVYQGN